MRLFNSLNDKINEVFQAVFGLAEFTAPLFGNVLYLALNMSVFDLMSLFCLIYALVLFWFNCGAHFMSDDLNFKKELKKFQHSDEGGGVDDLENIANRPDDD